MTGRGHIRRRGEHSWELKYDAPGNVPGQRITRFKTVKGTKRVAQAALTSILADVDRGTHVDPTKVTLRDFLQRWLTDWAASNVSAKTLERYWQLAGHQVIPRLGSMPVQRIRPADLQELYGALLREGRADGGPLAALTVGHCHRLLRRALGHAVTWGVVQQNVAAVVHAPRVRKDEIEIASDAEIKAILDHLRDRDRPLYTLAMVALATGARRGELCALRWQDIDLDGGFIRIERSLEQTRAGLAFKQPKTKLSRRTVSVPLATVAELRAHRLAQQEKRLASGLGRIASDNLVFTTGAAEPRKPDTLSTAWSRNTLAVLGRQVSLHTMRHVHASHLIAAGLDILTISRRLGHTRPTITLDVYGHMIHSSDDTALAAVEALLVKVSGGNPVAKTVSLGSEIRDKRLFQRD